MEAAHPEASTVRINFGDKHNAGTPIDLELVLDLFSAEQQQIRKNFAEEYKVEIPSTCLAFEFVVQEGQAKDKAEILAKIQEKLSVLEQIPNNFTTHYSGNKVLGLLQAPEFASLLQSYEQYFADLKESAKNEAHPIQMRILSHSDLGMIGKDLLKEGIAAWLHSLHYEFNFVKNDFITKVLITFCEKILENDNLSAMIKSFKKLNFEMNFTSSHHLHNYPKVKSRPVEKLPKSDFTIFFEEAGIERGRVFLINPTLFVKGDFIATGLTTLLKQILE